MNLLSVQGLGFLYSVCLFLICIAVVHLVKLARIGYRTLGKKLPPEKPKANGCYTNPEAPPTYTEEQTVITEEAKQPISQSTNQTGENDGKAYVEGFGYVDVGGSTKSVTGTSDGDINKMVGVMD